MKPKYYFCDLWRMNFHFFIGWSAEDFIAYVDKNFGRGLVHIPAAGVGKHLMIEKGATARSLIWVKYKGKNGFPTLAHECLHAANDTLDRAGWRPDLTNDEPQTYLMTNLIRQALGIEV